MAWYEWIGGLGVVALSAAAVSGILLLTTVRGAIGRVRRFKARLDQILPGCPPGLGRGVDGLIVVAGAVTLADVLYHLAQRDPRVLDTLDGMWTDGPLTSWSGLTDHLGHAHGAAAWQALVDRASVLTGVEGLAEGLRDQGHLVTLASAADGSEAWVDGHRVHLEPSADPAVLEAHLASASDLPIVTSSAHAEAFRTVDGVFSLDSAGDRLSALGDEMLDGASVVDGAAMDFPLITLAMSSGVNGLRLLRGRSTPTKVARNVVLDTAGRGGGGLAGGKTGGLVGALVGGPLGAAVGTLTGGILGAYVGNRITRPIKEVPLDSARDALDVALGAYPTVLIDALRDKAATLAQSAVDTRAPVRGWRTAWPSTGTLVRRMVARRHEARAEDLHALADRMDENLRNAEDPVALAQDWLSRPNGVYSTALADARARIARAVDDVTQERAALGYR